MTTATLQPRTKRPSTRIGTPVTLYLTPEQLARLEEIEMRFGASRSFLVRKALDNWLAAEGAELLR